MFTKIFIYAILLLLLFPASAHAYLDPGTGSYLFQILIAGFLGSLFFLKSIIRKVKWLFKRVFAKESVTEQISKDNENK